MRPYAVENQVKTEEQGLWFCVASPAPTEIRASGDQKIRGCYLPDIPQTDVAHLGHV